MELEEGARAYYKQEDREPQQHNERRGHYYIVLRLSVRCSELRMTSERYTSLVLGNGSNSDQL